jgi:ATP-dependent Lon protease
MVDDNYRSDEPPPASRSEDEKDEREAPTPQPVWPDLGSPAPSGAAAPEETREADSDSQEPEVKLPAELPILPLKDTVVYPFAVMPLGVGKERSIRLIDEIMRGDRLVGLVAQKDEEIEDARAEDCFRVGTVARIARLLRIPDGTIQIIVQGLERIRS